MVRYSISNKVHYLKIGGILTVLFLAVLSCKEGKEEIISKKPNIILIMADDLGFEALGSYGNTTYQTPYLDALSEGGMRFDNCYATPLCTPSRVQIMSGQYNFRNYVGFGILDPSVETFAHHLKKAGYATCVTGKWQLYGNTKQIELAGGKKGSMPNQAGFDQYCLWQTTALGSRYKNPVIDVNGAITKFEGKYGPDIFVDFIGDFIADHTKDPFFVYYPMALTHDPFTPSPDHIDFEEFDSSSRTNDPAYFGDMVTYMDKLIGKIVKKVDNLGLRDNTLILFVGDNGTDRKVTTLFRGSEIKGNKGFTTKYGTHVPLIVNWKGKMKPGQVNENLIDFTDFLPTLLDAASYEQKDQVFSDGISFYPQLFGDAQNVREWVFCHYDPRWGKFEKKRYVHDHDLKVYENGQIFNIKEDPSEQTVLKESELTPSDQKKALKFKEVLAGMNNP